MKAELKLNTKLTFNLSIKGSQIELTEDEIKELKSIIENVFPSTPTIIYREIEQPVSIPWIAEPEITYGPHEFTCSISR